jgi:hypothetical protein
MFRLYSDKRAEAIIAAMDRDIEACAADYGVPAPCLKGILFREIREIDLMDAAADAAVRLGLFGRDDSSTGYAQIFARTAVNSLRFAEERGIETAEKLGLPPLPPGEDPGYRRAVWLRLNGDRTFNLRLAALTLLSAAHEAAGTTDFENMTAEDMKRAFSRYNSSSCAVSSYGEEVYRHYLRYGGPPRP